MANGRFFSWGLGLKIWSLGFFEIQKFMDKH